MFYVGIDIAKLHHFPSPQQAASVVLNPSVA